MPVKKIRVSVEAKPLVDAQALHSDDRDALEEITQVREMSIVIGAPVIEIARVLVENYGDEGGYTVWTLDDETLFEMAAENRAIDAFHETTAIKNLEDFAITAQVHEMSASREAVYDVVDGSREFAHEIMQAGEGEYSDRLKIIFRQLTIGEVLTDKKIEAMLKAWANAVSAKESAWFLRASA